MNIYHIPISVGQESKLCWLYDSSESLQSRWQPKLCSVLMTWQGRILSKLSCDCWQNSDLKTNGFRAFVSRCLVAWGHPQFFAIYFKWSSLFYQNQQGDFLVVQWVELIFQCRGTLLWYLVQEDSSCLVGQISPCATTLSLRSRASAPQQGEVTAMKKLTHGN